MCIQVRSLTDQEFNLLSHTFSIVLLQGLRKLRISNNSSVLSRHNSSTSSSAADSLSGSGEFNSQDRHTRDVPLLFISMIGVVFVLYVGGDILVPFTISCFLGLSLSLSLFLSLFLYFFILMCDYACVCIVYLLRPFYLWLTTPFNECSLCSLCFRYNPFSGPTFTIIIIIISLSFCRIYIYIYSCIYVGFVTSHP